MSDVVGHSLRHKYNRQQPISIGDYPDYQQQPAAPEVLEPVRPPLDYYDDLPDYSNNVIPERPRVQQRPNRFRGNRPTYQPFEEVSDYKRRYPLALGSTGTTTTTTKPENVNPTLSLPSKRPNPEENAVKIPPPSKPTYFDQALNLQPPTTGETPTKDTNKQYQLNNSVRVKRRRRPIVRTRPQKEEVRLQLLLKNNGSNFSNFD